MKRLLYLLLFGLLFVPVHGQFINTRPTYAAQTITVPYDYDDEVQTYLDSLSTPLADSIALKINTFIVSLKDSLAIDSLDQVFDVMYLFANQTSEAALINLVKPGTNDATVVGSPTFTAFEGYTTVTDTYLNSNYNAATDYVNYTQNNCHALIYVKTDAATTASDFRATNANSEGIGLIARNTSDLITVRANSPATNGLNQYTSQGFFGYNRSSSTVVNVVRNGVFTSRNTKSTGVPNLDLYIGASNLNGTPGISTGRQYSFFCIGKSMTEAIHDDIKTLFEEYMDSNGEGIL